MPKCKEKNKTCLCVEVCKKKLVQLNLESTYNFFLLIILGKYSIMGVDTRGGDLMTFFLCILYILYRY